MKTFLLCLATLFGQLVLSTVVAGCIAGATSHLGAAAVGPWMLGVMGLQAVVFLAAAGICIGGALKLDEPGALRVVSVALTLCCQLGLAGTMIMANLVLFNR